MLSVNEGKVSEVEVHHVLLVVAAAKLKQRKVLTHKNALKEKRIEK